MRKGGDRRREKEVKRGRDQLEGCSRMERRSPRGKRGPDSKATTGTGIAISTGSRSDKTGGDRKGM